MREDSIFSLLLDHSLSTTYTRNAHLSRSMQKTAGKKKAEQQSESSGALRAHS